MASVNKVILVGNLGRDPEIRYTQGGTAIARFSLATSERFKNKDGEWEEKTEWHNVVFFGRLAEVCGEYLHKGKQVYVEGRLQTRKWQAEDGTDRYTTEVVGQVMQMLGSQQDGNGAGRGRSGGSARGSGRNDRRDPGQTEREHDDSIPF